jgi:DNA-binding FadR family transcriptional regulator
VLVELLQSRDQGLEYAMELALARAEASDLRRMERITHQLLDAFEAGDRAVLADGFVDWLTALVDAAHALPARWIANPFLALHRGLMSRFPGLWVLEPGFPAYLRDSLRALLERDPQLWRQASQSYYGRVDGVILEALRQLVLARGGHINAAASAAKLGTRHQS